VSFHKKKSKLHGCMCSSDFEALFVNYLGNLFWIFLDPVLTIVQTFFATTTKKFQRARLIHIIIVEMLGVVKN
jgi:hypothetical protein